ncbi:MAG: urate hydroxylase PuuD [Porticoccaceae bacterium]|nr:urate hydroxylase PuuD [Porticoccaceae bacterium]
MEHLLELLFRWGHGLFGVTWIGFLYYFNFVQGGYFKKASPEALADAKQHLAPAALWWFRWGAMFTFITGLYLFHRLSGGFNSLILVAAVMGTIMFLNVWLVIWPNQKVALGMVEGDAAAAGAKALLASRTNTLFSGPMLLGMLGSHSHAGALEPWWSNAEGSSTTGLMIMLAIVLLLELNALFGKQGPLASVKGVIHCSLLLSVVMAAVLHYL